MPCYNIHVYREMKLRFDGLEAESPEAAAEYACNHLASEASSIDDCDGLNLAALVDVVGDEEFSQSVTIDFEPERIRKAAPKLRDALRWITCCPMINGPVGTTAYIISDERMALARAAIAEADAAGIVSQPAAPELLEALRLAQRALNTAPRFRVGDTDSYEIAATVDKAIAQADAGGIRAEPAAPKLLALLEALLPYAEGEAYSLEKLKDSPEAEVEAETAWKAVEAAQAAVAEAKAAGIPPLSATGARPSRFQFTHEPEENPDRAYLLVDGKFDVKIVRTDEGIVIDAYSGDGIDVVGTMTVWDEDVAEPEHDAAEGAQQP